ncbi:hypothetical protein ACU8V7_14885 [Zobellia nedashkovskayae]
MVSSCSNDSPFETPIEDEEDEDLIFEIPIEDENTTGTLVFNDSDSSKDIKFDYAEGEVGTTVPGRIIFTSTSNQKRLYITQNISGGGEMPFNNFNIEGKDLTKALKGDGSVDLDGDNQKAIDFTFELPVPDIDNGEIVYHFWTTTGKGDFRDANKRLALGVGTITVKVGNGVNAAAEVRSFTDVKLSAPAADGSSESFFSLLNETVYKINEGPEFRAFWDFGYYYVNSKAYFTSADTYNEVFVEAFNAPVEGLEPGDDEEDAATETLNKTYFQLSTTNSTGFDGITLSGELDFVEKSTFQTTGVLAVGDVIEFVDNYGKKGLIKITEIKPGYIPSTDYIKFDVKIQP